MIYLFDIDNTLCKTKYGHYEKAEPYYDRIKKVNELYDAGNTINIWTGRGVMTGNDWMALTKMQLALWGVKYHRLMTKPFYFDVIVDDTCQSDKQFFT